LISPCLVAAGLAASLVISPQQVTTSVRVYDEIFLTDTGLLALPEKAIELTSETTIKSDYFKAPVFISGGRSSDGAQYLYCSASGSPVLKFSLDGKLAAELGQKQNKPGGYNLVRKIRVSRNGAWLVAYEADKQVLNILIPPEQLRKRKKRQKSVILQSMIAGIFMWLTLFTRKRHRLLPLQSGRSAHYFWNGSASSP